MNDVSSVFPPFITLCDWLNLSSSADWMILQVSFWTPRSLHAQQEHTLTPTCQHKRPFDQLIDCCSCSSNFRPCSRLHNVPLLDIKMPKVRADAWIRDFVVAYPAWWQVLCNHLTFCDQPEQLRPVTDSWIMSSLNILSWEAVRQEAPRGGSGRWGTCVLMCVWSQLLPPLKDNLSVWSV